MLKLEEQLVAHVLQLKPTAHNYKRQTSTRKYGSQETFLPATSEIALPGIEDPEGSNSRIRSVRV